MAMDERDRTLFIFDEREFGQNDETEEMRKFRRDQEATDDNTDAG